MPDIMSANLTITDITGKTVFDNVIVTSAQIDLAGIEKGMYFIRIVDPTSYRTVVKKLLIN